MADLLPLADAQARLLALAGLTAVEEVPLGDALHRWLAASLTAQRTQPATDVSAMDGWALRFADCAAPLRIIGESAAGHPFAGSVGAGEAVRIFTGAHMPAGADTVAVQEDMRADGATLRRAAQGPPAAGAHIRRRGQDFLSGAPIAAEGQLVTAALIGLAAAAGQTHLPVRRRPRVAIIATGSELVGVGETAGPGHIISSNGPMLAAMLADAAVADHGIVADSLDALCLALESACDSADIVVTIGGASVGDHDLVRPALARIGAALDFWRIAIRPGKPLLAGKRGDVIIIGLPGNPVSAYVCALLFLLPLVRHMAGAPQPLPRETMAIVTRPLPANGARRDFMRATLADAGGVLHVTPFAAQDSSMLSRLAAAHALLVRPEQAPPVPAGASVPVLILG